MRTLFVIAALLLASPAYAIDWHLGMEAGINDDDGIETTIDFSVERWYVEASARNTNYYDATMVEDDQLHAWACGRCFGSDPTLVWSSGLQWSAEVHFRAFPDHGPVARFVDRGELDRTYFLGWRAEFGSW